MKWNTENRWNWLSDYYITSRSCQNIKNKIKNIKKYRQCDGHTATEAYWILQNSTVQIFLFLVTYKNIQWLFQLRDLWRHWFSSTLPLLKWIQIELYPEEAGKGSWNCTLSLLRFDPLSDGYVCYLDHNLKMERQHSPRCYTEFGQAFQSL